MMEVQLSIIVPIYKTEPFLVRCFESLMMQKGEGLEFILVNDGSPDDSEAICQQYLQKDTRFKYFSKPNGGLSSARNYGMKHAVGQYIGFLDSDDYLEPQYWEVLKRTMDQNPVEVIGFNHFYEKQEAKTKVHSCFSKGTVLYQTDTLEILKSSTWNQCLFFVWNKIYRRQWMEEIKLIFDETVLLAEDKPFNARIILEAATQFHIPDALVNYVYYEHSLSQASFKPDLLTKYEAQFFALTRIYEQHGLLGNSEFSTDIAQNYLGHALIMQLNNLVYSKENKGEVLKKMRQSPIYDFSFVHFKPSPRMSLFQRTLIYLFRIRQFSLLINLFILIRARK